MHRPEQRIHNQCEAVDSADMAQTVCIILSFEDRLCLAAVIEDRNRPQKHVQRGQCAKLS
jgi:hypothetical protein